VDDKNYIRDLAGRIRSKVDPSELPDKGLDDLFDSYAVLALSKGVAVTNEDVHDAWSAWATKYDPTNKSLVPFIELPQDVQADDTRFTDAIRAVAMTLS
jgi:hypothetical protein